MAPVEQPARITTAGRARVARFSTRRVTNKVRPGCSARSEGRQVLSPIAPLSARWNSNTVGCQDAEARADACARANLPHRGAACSAPARRGGQRAFLQWVLPAQRRSADARPAESTSSPRFGPRTCAGSRPRWKTSVDAAPTAGPSSSTRKRSANGRSERSDGAERAQDRPRPGRDARLRRPQARGLARAARRRRPLAGRRATGRDPLARRARSRRRRGAPLPLRRLAELERERGLEL